RSGPAVGGTTVTITGTGFTGVTSVGFGSTDVNVQSGATDTELVVVSPGGTGTVDLTVTTPAGTSATSSNDQFTYVAPMPVVTGLTPTRGPPATGATVPTPAPGSTDATTVRSGRIVVN